MPRTGWIVMIVLCGTCAVLWADPDEDVKLRLDRIHRPQDTAPSRQTVVPRPHTDYRVEGGLLHDAAHRPRRVDVDELASRKRGLYDGKVYTDDLASAGEANPATAPPSVAVAEDQGTRTPLGTMVYWCVVALCAFATAWFLAKTVLARLSRRRRAT